MLGIFMSGGAMFLLETNYTQDLLGELISSGNVRNIVTTQEFAKKLPPSVAPESLVRLHHLIPKKCY